MSTKRVKKSRIPTDGESEVLADLALVGVSGVEMLKEIVQLETASYPHDEKASPEKLAYRAKEAGDYFRVLTRKGSSDVLGFINGTLTSASTLTEESMSVHEPNSPNLCIHSVVIHHDHRRKGFATRMMTMYLQGLPETVREIYLMTKKPLIPFYSSCGFQLVGQSPVEHGADPWFDMKQVMGGREGTDLTDNDQANNTAETSGGGTVERKFDLATADAHKVPALAVFDLDACFWDEEMYMMRKIVDRKNPVMGPLGDAGVGVAGARSGRSVIQIHKGALLALQRFYRGDYPGMRIAAASSADTPQAVKIGRSALDLLEIVPGVTAREVFNIGWPAGFEGNLQIGRTPPLSSDKSRTHFPLLKRETKIPFDRMLFFDDCNWSDNCGEVQRGCKEASSGLGPAIVRTPEGLQPEHWIAGLKQYRERL